MSLVYALLISLICLASYLRWWRVAQREHYEPRRLTAISGLWMRARPVNFAVYLVTVAVAVVGCWFHVAGVVAALLWLAWPVGMSFFGTRRVVWTDRMKRLAAVNVVLFVVVAAIAYWIGLFTLLPVLTLVIGEWSLSITARWEAALARKWQVAAAAKIAKVHPRVVAITGSYGKTSTKNYATHLMQGRWSTLASPASFNNVMGLSRAVNDRLEPGTDVFVAEMGTYGVGEIARLTELFPPEVSAITVIGEAHLERMKTRATIVTAKKEILPPARTIVLNVDVPELAAAAEEYAVTKRVIRCSVTAGTDAEVLLVGDRLTVEGETRTVTLPEDVGHPINVAIAVGLALAVDVPLDTIVERLPGVPATPHRAEANRAPNGTWVIDDTFNSNPTGAAAALARAEALAGETGTVWTITPGMVELGSEQARRNADFARAATATERLRLCVVGRTNRVALAEGDAERTHWFPSREKAADFVLKQAGPQDVVLYENDLPDHYA